MKITVGTLTSHLETDNPALLRVLGDKYAYLVPGYNYVPSYRARRWDGKKRYFSAKGVFRTGLLPRIVKNLEEVGASPEVDYGKVCDAISCDPIGVESYNYRDYQEKAIKEACICRRFLINSPTGSGKTLIMAGILKTLGAENKKAIILFKEKGILNQTFEFFKACGIKNLGANSGDGYQRGNIMLSTVQSLGKIIDDYLDADILMVDEVHQFGKGELTIAAIQSFPEAKYRFGFTATIPSEKDDIHGRLTLEGAFGKVHTTRTMEDLIDDGDLAKPIIQVVDYSPSGDFSDMTYQDIYDEFIVNSPNRNEIIARIVSLIKESYDESKILILVNNLQHIKNLKDLITDAISIEGKDSIAIRYELINDFKSLPKSVMIGTKVMQTGISIDEITHMINARGLEGEIPTIQGLGRGVRKADGKSVVYYYDFYDKVKYLEKHSKKRIKHYKSLKLEVNNVSI